MSRPGIVRRSALARPGETAWETSIRTTLWTIALLLAGILLVLLDRL